MKKTDCTTVKLSTGAVSVYDFGTAKLHAYQTNDPLADEVFVVEKDGKGVVLEYPPFVANIEELGGYIVEQGIEIEGIVAAYHMAGASFLPGTPVFATKEADEYGHTGGGKALIDGFATAFGASFDASVPGAVTYIEGDELELAGVKMGIVRNDDAFDIEIPELNAVYTHMLGHDCHSIVAGAGPAHPPLPPPQDHFTPATAALPCAQALQQRRQRLLRNPAEQRRPEKKRGRNFHTISSIPL